MYSSLLIILDYQILKVKSDLCDKIESMKRLLTILCLILLLGGCAGKKEPEPEIPQPVEVVDREPERTRADRLLHLNAIWDKNYAINNDYWGDITVGHYFIYPFVKGATNDTYIRTDWKTMNYDEEGSVFLDYRNNMGDQNLIIYGHYVYASYDASGTHKFTMLRQLMSKDNYKDNRFITLHLKDELRVYEIGLVYYCDTYVADDGNRYTNPALQYYHLNYDPDYFYEYLANAKNASFYETDVELSADDELLTLQTCVAGNEDLREIVLARLIRTEKLR